MNPNRVVRKLISRLSNEAVDLRGYNIKFLTLQNEEVFAFDTVR